MRDDDLTKTVYLLVIAAWLIGMATALAGTVVLLS